MTEMIIRDAKREDIPEIVAMLQDDFLGSAREDDTNLGVYEAAFDVITKDPHNRLLVGERNGSVIATCQITIIPSFSISASIRGQIEGVRVSKSHRGQGLGETLIRAAIEALKEQNCGLVQLTMNKAREGAYKFYRRLGFVDSHEGFKLNL